MDYKGFEKYVFKRYSPDDQMQIVLEGYLHVESILTSLLKKYFPHPEYFDFDCLRFEFKLNLACACGIITVQEKSALMKLNGFRNKFTLNLNFKLSESQISDLANCLDEATKSVLEMFFMEHVGAGETRASHVKRLKYTITLMYALLDLQGKDNFQAGKL